MAAAFSQHNSANLKSPRHWPSWCAIALGWLVAKLPYRLQMAIGSGLGRIAFYIVPERRRVAAINLRLCFPDMDDSARDRLVRAHFRSVGKGAVETVLCWWGSRKQVEQLGHIEGAEYLTEAAAHGRGLILLSAHFTSLELGVRIGGEYLRRLGYETTAMYKPPHDPVLDHVMRSRRDAHILGQSIADDDIFGLRAALKRGDAVWYAGDQKAGPRLSTTVDFFGQPARTHTAVSRMARMSRAPVVPFFTLRRADGKGYRLIVQPALADFPSGDEAADAARLNKLIESVIAQDPAQYFWLHQRFKRKGYNPYKKRSKAR